MRFFILYMIITGLMIIGSCQKPELIDPADIEIEVEADTLVFAVIGDYGYDGIHEEDVADMVKSWDPDFILTTGDNNYENGALETLEANISKYYGDYIYNYDAPENYRCNGNAFMEKINRFFPSPGNHDVRSLAGIRPYLNFFTLPGIEEYYTFSWGDISFYSLNSTATLIREQERWLENEIEKSNKKYNIVYFHHSPYSGGKHGNERKMQLDFYNLGVDIVFTGHDHIYSRIEKADEPGLHYIICGNSGRSRYECGASELDPEMFEVNCFDADYGAVKCIYDGSSLTVEYFQVESPEIITDSLEFEAR